MNGKLEPVFVPAEDTDNYGVGEEGWYAMDDDLQVFDGPFASRAECMKALADLDKPKAA